MGDNNEPRESSGTKQDEPAWPQPSKPEVHRTKKTHQSATTSKMNQNKKDDSKQKALADNGDTAPKQPKRSQRLQSNK